jgi:hypothetical protein
VCSPEFTCRAAFTKVHLQTARMRPYKSIPAAALLLSLLPTLPSIA